MTSGIEALERNQPVKPSDHDVTVGRRWFAWPPSPPQALVLALVLCVISGLIGWRIAQPSHPGHSSVDVGFLEDMQTHHQQALELSYGYLEHGTNPLLRQIAREIINDQGIEIGEMRSVLGSWGLPSTPDPTARAMAWMHEPYPSAQQMPGMASSQDLQTLRDAQGPAAEEQFTRLMIRHHDGGIHMADYAAAAAQTPNIRNFARGISSSQRGEIDELNRIRQQLGFQAIPYEFSSPTPPRR
jgi:uncharacterized protein (DUF305 family)